MCTYIIYKLHVFFNKYILEYIYIFFFRKWEQPGGDTETGLWGRCCTALQLIHIEEEETSINNSWRLRCRYVFFCA